MNQDGKVLDGNHRAEVDKDWETKIIQTENRFKELLVRAHAHHRRRVPQEETRALVEEMAESLAKDGIPATEIATKLVDCLPYSENYTRSLIPDIYKNPLKAEAGQKGGEKSATISEQKVATISERKQTVTIQDAVECDRCHVSTSAPVEWHNHQLCESCHTKAEADPDGFNGYFTTVNKKPQPQVALTTDTPRSLDSWEVRKAQMSPQHSKFEGLVISSLIESGVSGIVQDRRFCVLETIPDIYLPSQNLAIYLDSSETHNGNRLDKDEKLRELLTKRHGVKVLPIPYDSTSKRAVEEIVKSILAEVENCQKIHA